MKFRKMKIFDNMIYNEDCLIGMKYNIVLADPPWQYNDSGIRGSAEHHYKTMTLMDIKNLPIHKFLADDCALFLWTTWPFIFEAEKVINAWGFRYKTLAFIWIKRNKNKNTLFTGCGHWTRSNSEICLLATRGKPIRMSASIKQVVISPRLEHSQKPSIVRDLIIKLMGGLPRIELFAREKTRGWHVWGDEIESNIQL